MISADNNTLSIPLYAITYVKFVEKEKQIVIAMNNGKNIALFDVTDNEYNAIKNQILAYENK